MLNNFEDLIQAVQDDETIGNESTLYPLALIKRAINRAYVKAHSLFLWTETKEALKTTTQANLEYYDYPQTWRSDSIWRVEIDGDQYGELPDGSPSAFEDYLTWRNDPANANSTETKWATQMRRYFVFPVPTVADLEITVWGHRVPESLTDNANVTVFSYSMPEGNEAIVLEAVAILKSKGELEKSSEFRSAEAKLILVGAWDREKKAQSKYEKTQPFFDVPDFFQSSRVTSKNRIGNFN